MKLNKYREQIDSIDEEIVNLLAERFKITAAIGIIKKDMDIKSISPERENQQFSKLKLLAKNKKLPYKLIEQIFHLIIDQVVRNHESIKSNNT